MNYLEKWAENLSTVRSQPLRRTVRVEGIHKAHLGPRMEFARVEFEAEPADRFIAVVRVPGIEADVEKQRFIEWAIFGLLDVVMLAEPSPLKNMRITVLGLDVDPVDSSMMAFRLAGREAGRRLLEDLRSKGH